MATMTQRDPDQRACDRVRQIVPQPVTIAGRFVVAPLELCTPDLAIQCILLQIKAASKRADGENTRRRVDKSGLKRLCQVFVHLTDARNSRLRRLCGKLCAPLAHELSALFVGEPKCEAFCPQLAHGTLHLLGLLSSSAVAGSCPPL